MIHWLTYFAFFCSSSTLQQSRPRGRSVTWRPSTRPAPTAASSWCRRLATGACASDAASPRPTSWVATPMSSLTPTPSAPDAVPAPSGFLIQNWCSSSPAGRTWWRTSKLPTLASQVTMQTQTNGTSSWIIVIHAHFQWWQDFSQISAARVIEIRHNQHLLQLSWQEWLCDWGQGNNHPSSSRIRGIKPD